MTTRDDVVVDFDESPRIIEVQAPSTEMGMQDLVDTLRKIEDGFSTGMPHEKLLNASGKEDLGDGVLVGITADLQNAQLSFEPRRTAAVVGTVTTGSGASVSGPLGPSYNFVDTGADFVAAGVQRGSLAINFTDMSVGDVLEVVSSTELRTRVLVNGSDNEWDIGDDYHIFNIIQCNATGGNLVAADEFGARITSVFPTAFVQVVRTASSSATLQGQDDIQFGAFNGGVTLDVINGVSGTDHPIGTPRLPVNNLADAKTIAAEHGFMRLYIIGDFNFISTDTLTGFTIIGENEERSMVDIDVDATMDTCEFNRMTLTGTLDNDSRVIDCKIDGLDFRNGEVINCRLQGTMSLSGSQPIQFIGCSSAVIGTATPIIDMGGDGPELGIRGYNGGITLRNKTGVDSVSIDLASGQVVIEDTVTTGTIVLRGVGKWTNEDAYVGGADVINELLNPDSIGDHLDSRTYDGVAYSDILTRMLSMATGRIVESSPGVYDFYEQDNTTILFTLTKAGSQRTRS